MPASKITDNTIYAPRISRTASVRDIPRFLVATGGDEIRNVGLYRYHLFSNSGNFVVTNSGSAQVIVIGGGAGGGAGMGAGGGGAIEPSSGYTDVQLGLGSYSVVIGSGGSHASSGSNSTFTWPVSQIIARGGGTANTTGGSGGGGNLYASGGGALGSNTNPGGAGGPLPPGPYGGGGGGGAGAAGGNYPSGTGGSGKLLSNIDSNLTSANFPTLLTGVTHFSSGGGGGGYAGMPAGNGGPGGGNGRSGGPTPGTAATWPGCGGGGGGHEPGVGTGQGGAGFKGLVIIRYFRS